jgi:DNA-binding transcriptional MerR regulator
MQQTAKQFNNNAFRSSTTESGMKIGTVSKETGIGIETLRFYERSGLLDEPLRTNSGYRLYSHEVFDRLAFIKQAQLLGFTLDEIRQLIAEKRAGKSPCSHVRDFVRRRLSELDERMLEMNRYRMELASALEQWDLTGDTDGHICGLIEGSHLEHGLEAENRLKAYPKNRG